MSKMASSRAAGGNAADDDDIRAESGDRERIVSAKGILDTHYELEIETDFGDLDARKYTAFNPAKAANATANWSGLMLSTEKWREVYDHAAAVVDNKQHHVRFVVRSV